MKKKEEYGCFVVDCVFEPFMKENSHIQQALGMLFGPGDGAGIAIVFFCVGISGFIISLSRLRKPIYGAFDENVDIDNSKEK